VYISQDPIGFASGEPNFYAYVNDPNSFIDPFGLAGCAASNLPRLRGKSVKAIEKMLRRRGFTRTQNNNNNQTWKHTDGSEVRIHRHGNQNRNMQNGNLTPKSGLNAHIHKEDSNGNQLNDRGQVRNPQTHPEETHIGIKNPSTLPAARNRPHGDGA
jgi:uncharacterized protein RhaS with RHS repeats